MNILFCTLKVSLKNHKQWNLYRNDGSERIQLLLNQKTKEPAFL